MVLDTFCASPSPQHVNAKMRGLAGEDPRVGVEEEARPSVTKQDFLDRSRGAVDREIGMDAMHDWAMICGTGTR